MISKTSTQAFVPACLWVRLGAGLLVLGGLTGWVAPVAAQSAATAAPTNQASKPPQTVAVELGQFKVVTSADGKEQLVDASSVKPGDVLEYRATYTNHTGREVGGLVADLPIPEGLEYLPRSARPGATQVQAAVKDGLYAPEPLMRRTPDNKSEPVPYADYRALRWTLGRLPAGGVTAVSARAKVEVVVPPPPKTSAAVPQAPPVSAKATAGAVAR
jgi:uncharacterized repeat protein (TIGR01451 family)